MKIYITVFRSVRIITKSASLLGHVCPFLSLSIPPYACIIPDTAERIYVKFSIGDFRENLSEDFHICLKSAKMLDIVHEELIMFYCCRRHKFSVKAFLSGTYYCLLLMVAHIWTVTIGSSTAFPLPQWLPQGVAMLHFTYLTLSQCVLISYSLISYLGQKMKAERLMTDY